MPASTGVRERNRAERYRAIREAARSVFAEKGYEDATTREIAARAGIAIGTLFAYADDKRDLLLITINDDLDVLTNATFASVPRDAPFLDQLAYVFGRRYAFWARHPDLSRIALQEKWRTEDRQPSVEMRRYAYRRETIIDALAALVEAQQERGALRADEPPRAMAWVVYALYMAHVRLWLTSDQPEAERGIARLVEALRLVVRGLGTTPPQRSDDRPAETTSPRRRPPATR